MMIHCTCTTTTGMMHGQLINYFIYMGIIQRTWTYMYQDNLLTNVFCDQILV